MIDQQAPQDDILDEIYCSGGVLCFYFFMHSFSHGKLNIEPFMSHIASRRSCAESYGGTCLCVG